MGEVVCHWESGSAALLVYVVGLGVGAVDREVPFVLAPRVSWLKSYLSHLYNSRSLCVAV